MRLPLLPTILSEQSSKSFSNRLSSLSEFILHDLYILMSIQRIYSDDTTPRGDTSSFSEFLSLPSDAALHLYLWDHLMTGIALPKLPHVEFIGGLTARAAKELNGELRDWADAASEGFVMCTFGSIVIPNAALLEKILQLFEELQPISVIFKLNRKHLPEQLVSRVPKNVFLVDWLPQNDLLGHPNARLYITHSGSLGYGEALYHGVPMLAFSFIFIQKFMAEKIEALGFGREVSLFTMNGTELATIAKEVLTDERYRQRVQKVSKIIKSRKHPGEIAADAVEHVMNFGADHLRPKGSLDLNLINFYMMDILVIILILILGLLWVTFVILYYILRCLWIECSYLWKRSLKHKLD